MIQLIPILNKVGIISNRKLCSYKQDYVQLFSFSTTKKIKQNIESIIIAYTYRHVINIYWLNCYYIVTRKVYRLYC